MKLVEQDISEQQPQQEPSKPDDSQLEPNEQDVSEQQPQHEPSDPDSCQQDPIEVESSQLELSDQDISEQQSQQEPSEQSEFSIDSAHSMATSSVAEAEPTFDYQSESGQSLGGNSASTNSSHGIDEHLLLGDFEKAAARMIDNNLKRKDLPEMDAVCSAAKKSKPSQEVENAEVIPFPVECK